MCVCVQAARRKNVQTRQLRDKKETNDAHVVRRRYSFKNSRWILDDDTNRCQSNLSSLFFYFHFLLERLFVRNISFPSEYNPRVFFFFVPFSFFFFDLARIVRPREIPPQFVAPSTDSSTNLNARADRRSTGPVYHPAQRRVLSGSVSYRVGRARPFMPTDFQTRTERAPTYTTRACAWTKMAVV